MKRLLIVVPVFPPNNSADCHRARMALPYFKKHGWEAEVLCVHPRFVEAKADDELLDTLPQNVPVHRCNAIPFQLTRRFGLGGIGWRSRAGLNRMGKALLRKGDFHAIYFSSTVFSSFGLGPEWRHQFGIPYFIDYHDPMWTDYYFKTGAPKPPGGMFKYKITHWLARKKEAEVIRGAAGVTCVSPGYVQLLRDRYLGADPEKYIELSFGAPERDAELAGLRREDGGFREGSKEVWRYVGAGGGIMADAVRIFAHTLKENSESVRSEWKKFKIQFLGTSYATYGSPAPSLSPVLGEIVPQVEVEEKSERLPYMESIRQLRSADRLILFGTNDPGYTASKLGVYVLARRPLLVICREESSVARIVRETRAGELITFGEQEIKMKIKIKKEWEEAMGRWLAMDPAREPATDWKAFEPYTARKTTEKLCRFFDERLEAAEEGVRSEHRGWRGWSRKFQSASILNAQSSALPRVLLVHPGVQHAPRLAEALEGEGLLARFWTGWAKAGFGGGKRDVEIPEEKLRTRRWVEWAALALSKSGIDSETVWHWRNGVFQNLIPEGEILAADVVVGFDTGSWILARKAKAMGKNFILDQSIGHPAARIPVMAKMGRAEETWEEPYLPRPGRLADWEKVEHELADRIVVGSQFTRNTLIGQGVPADKIRILPYGVGKEFVGAGERRDGARKCGKIRFLYLGQLTQRKGLRFLLEAWREIPTGRAELILMGGANSGAGKSRRRQG